IWHLRTALRKAVPRMRQLRTDLHTSLLSLLSLLPDADWDLVRPLMNSGQKGRNDALELAAELLSLESEIRGGPGAIHSSRHALAILAGARRIRNKACTEIERQSIFGRVQQWLVEALVA